MTSLLSRLVIAVTVFCAGLGVVPGYTALPPPFSIKISTVDNTIHTGQEIVVDVVLENTSDKPLQIHSPHTQSRGDPFYRISVIKSNGSEVEPREQYRGLNDWIKGPYIEKTQTLNPGQMTEGKILLSTLYDLSAPGTYLVRVRGLRTSR